MTAALVEIPAQAVRPDTARQAELDRDEALVLLHVAGDPEALAEIYRLTYETVFRFVHFRVGNRQLAEDLTQDTYVRAMKRLASFQTQQSPLQAWLITIARNLVADHFKSSRYRLEVLTDADADSAAGIHIALKIALKVDGGIEGRPESAVVEHLTNLEMLTGLSHLSEEQQQCLALRYLSGLSVGETARAMGKTENAIKALQYRGTRALARAVDLEALR